MHLMIFFQNMMQNMGPVSQQLQANPFFCASCHPSPALGINTGPQMYLSQALHGSHATKRGIHAMTAIREQQQSATGVLHILQTTEIVPPVMEIWQMLPVYNCNGRTCSMGNRTSMCYMPYWSRRSKYRNCSLQELQRAMVICIVLPVMEALMQCTLHGKLRIIISQNNTRGLQQLSRQLEAAGFATISSRGEEGHHGRIFRGTWRYQSGRSYRMQGLPYISANNTSDWPHAYTWKNSNYKPESPE